MRKWATRKLRSGDLTTLAAIARGSIVSSPERIARLRRRHFVEQRGDGQPAITVPGRLALLVKHLTLV